MSYDETLWQIAKRSAADATRTFFMPFRRWEVWVFVISLAVFLTWMERA